MGSRIVVVTKRVLNEMRCRAAAHLPFFEAIETRQISITI